MKTGTRKAAQTQIEKVLLRGMKSRCLCCLFLIVLIVIPVIAQSGRNTAGSNKTILNLFISPIKPNAKFEVTKDSLALFDGGASQMIESVVVDGTPAHVVLLVDTSSSLRVTGEVLNTIAHKLLSELYGDDKAMVISFAESAEVIEAFTTDANKLRNATAQFQKSGQPRLFDALFATLDDAFVRQLGSGGKRVLILISDGYDRGSETKFQYILNRYQEENIVVYVIAPPDRSYGVGRRDAPKATEVIQQLTEGTGGKAYDLQDAEKAAKEIAEEMRSRWYQLIYSPTGVSQAKLRRLLITVYDNKFKVRTKSNHPK